MLNQWFGALMQSFHLLPFAAKVIYSILSYVNPFCDVVMDVLR